MLQDVEARRLTEIDYLNGGIVRFGDEHGVPTPLNRAVVALIKGMEALVDAELTRRYANVREGDGASTTSTPSSSPGASTAASRGR